MKVEYFPRVSERWLTHLEVNFDLDQIEQMSGEISSKEFAT